jgi:hypothetical protein
MGKGSFPDLRRSRVVDDTAEFEAEVFEIAAGSRMSRSSSTTGWR